VTGIALPLYELPTALLDLPTVRDRVHDRHGQPEVQFHWWHEPTFLPVRLCGRIQLVRWGSKARRGTPLPPRRCGRGCGYILSGITTTAPASK
jgi:hypothetical protein